MKKNTPASITPAQINKKKHNQLPFLAKTLVYFVLSSVFLGSLIGTLWSFDKINTLKNKKNYAILGYDTVAYFTEKKPVEGNVRYSLHWNDAIWLFSSAENLSKFKKEPEKYAPQYGGYCAWGIAKNGLYSITPKAWEVYNGKLYLNFSSGVQRTWLKDKDAFILRANKNWKALIAKN